MFIKYNNAFEKNFTIRMDWKLFFYFALILYERHESISYIHQLFVYSWDCIF